MPETTNDPMLPITDEVSLDAAIAEIDRLVDLHPAERSEADEARLDELGTAVHEYESTHNPIKGEKGTTPS